MADGIEFEFHISDTHPELISLTRLNEYLRQLAVLFGNKDSVHLIEVRDQSAAPVLLVDQNVAPKVERRLMVLAIGGGGREAQKAFNVIDSLLVEDSTSAFVRGPHGRLLTFPGIKKNVLAQIGPVKESGFLQGEIVQIGGRDETISVYVRDRDRRVYICNTSREKGKLIAKHLFGSTVRVFGEMIRLRSSEGIWEVIGFTIDRFEALSDVPISEAVGLLRSISSSAVRDAGDPSAFLEGMNGNEQ